MSDFSRRQACLIYNHLTVMGPGESVEALLALCDAPHRVHEVDTIEGMIEDPTSDRQRAAAFLRNLAQALESPK